MEIGSIVVRIQAITDNFQRGTEKAQASLSNLERGIARLQRAAIAFAGLYIFRRFISEVGDAIKTAADFSLSMAHISRMTDMADVSIKGLAEDFRKLSLIIPIPVQQLGEMGVLVAQAGVNTRKEILAIVEAAGKLKTLNKEMSIETSVKALIQLAKAFNLPLTMAENFASAIQYAGDESIGGANDVVEASLRMVSAGKTLGFLPAQLIAIASLTIDVGVSAERAGMTWNRAFLQLVQNAKQAASAMKISFLDFEEMMREDAMATLMLLLAKIAEIPSKVEKIKVVQDIFAGVAIRGVGPILDVVDKLKERVGGTTSSFEEGTYIAKQYAKVIEEIATQTKLLSNTLVLLKQSVGTEFLKVLKETLSPLAETIKGLTPIGIVLTKTIGIIISAIMNFNKALYAVKDGILILIHTIVGLFSKLLLSIIELLEKIPLIGKEISKLSEKFKKDLNENIISTQQNILKIGKNFDAIAEDISNSYLAQYFADLAKSIEQIATGEIFLPKPPEEAPTKGKEPSGIPSNEKLQEQLAERFGLIQEHAQQVQELLTELGDADLMRSQTNAEALKGLLNTIKENYVTVWGTIFNFMNMGLKTFGTAFANALESIMNGTKKVREAFKQLGKDMIAAIIRFVAEWAAQLVIMFVFGALIHKFISKMAEDIAASWMKAAILASTATLGGAAAVGTAAVGVALAIGKGMLGAMKIGQTVETVPKVTQQAQYGGLLTEPTMMMGMRSGKLGIAGEAGPEEISPINKQAATPPIEKHYHINISGNFLANDPIVMDNFVREHIIPAIDRSEDKVVS